MAKARSLFLICAMALAVCHFKQSAFVPPSGQRRAAALTVPAAAVLVASTPAFADEIGSAAGRLAAAAYPLMKDVDWLSDFYWKKPGNAPASMMMKAVDKAIVMGIAMDSGLRQQGVLAHHQAIEGISRADPVLKQGDFENIIASIGRMIASVPEETTMDVYTAFAKVVNPSVGPFVMRMVDEAHARAAYAEFLNFKDVVKANPISGSTPSTPADIAAKLGQLDIPAAKLALLSKAFVKDVDWTSDLALTPIPSISSVEVAKALDKLFVVGAAMDGKLLSDAAEAHHKAIEGLDASLVVPTDQLEAIINGIAKALYSVPGDKVMDAYRTLGELVGPAIPKYLMNTVDPDHAKLAYEAFVDFAELARKL